MKVAIIGAGSVGRALGVVWDKAGHEVVFGLRDPADARYAELPGGKGQVAEAAAGADVTVLAVPFGALEDVAKDLTPDFDGVLVDCTNPINADFSGLDPKGAPSGAQHLQSLLPDARIVKAFNQTGAANMEDAYYPQGRVLNLICSDDDAAASVVRQLSEDAGFDSVVVRGLEHSRQLEEMAWLWITLAIKQEHGADFAYALVRR